MAHPSLKYYSVYFFQFLLFLQLMYGSDSIAISLLTPFIITVIVPIFEFIYSDSQTRNDPLSDPSLDYLYQIPLLIWTPMQVLLLIIFSNYIHTFSPICLILFAISVGMVNGSIGINVAHELLHKHSFILNGFAKVLLCSVCYGHFYIEHIWGHHKKVATIYDPATALMNEDIYHFLPRSIIGGYKDAYEICKTNSFPANVNFFGAKLNGVIIFNVFTVVYLSIMTYYFGLAALCFLLIQSLTAIIMLESANYIEHYGLLRDIDTKVSIMHSWNCDNFVTKALAFGLPNHSDHHYNSKKEYYKLSNYDYSPKLPFGYITCILIAYLPPIWFELMNQKLCEFGKRCQ